MTSDGYYFHLNESILYGYILREKEKEDATIMNRGEISSIFKEQKVWLIQATVLDSVVSTP